MDSIGGLVWFFSLFRIVQVSMRRRSAGWPWLNLNSKRCFRIWLSSVLGSQSKSFFLNDLRVTEENDKRAMLLCPGGLLGHYNGRCHYMPDPVARYPSRISGRLLDRVDLQIEVPALAEEDLTRNASSESSLTVCARTIADLAGTDGVAGAHFAETIQYRRMDRA